MEPRISQAFSKEDEKELKRKLKLVSKHLAKMKYTDVPLVRIVIHRNANIMLATHKDNKPISDQDKYVQQLNECIVSLQDNFRDLELAEIFLKERRHVKSIVKKGVTDPDYIRYHIENSFFRLLKIKDQICLLLKHYFQLPYPDFPGLEYKLVKDQFLKSNGLNLFIIYFQECFKNIRKMRNKIAHHANYEASDIAMLQAILLHPKITPKYRKVYFQYKESAILLFTFLSKKYRQTLHEAMLQLLITLNQGFNQTYEQYSGELVADKIKFKK